MAELIDNENEAPKFPKKEKASGTWKHDGKEENVQFNKEWSNHTFTDEEVEKLLNDETIHITAKSNRTGNDFDCDGKLEHSEFNGFEYVGFKADFMK